MAIFKKFAKIFPFFVLRRLNECAPRGAVILTFMNKNIGGSDWGDEPEHPTAEVDIFNLFDGMYMFTDERFNLEKKRARLRKEPEDL